MSNSRQGGVLVPPGSYTSNQVGGKAYSPAAYYPSSSGKTAPGLPAGKAYTVCEVNDGTLSCDCPGWTRRNPPGGRTCKHTQDYANLVPVVAVTPQEAVVAKPVVHDAEREKGGSLSDLFTKLAQGDM